eukprot:scaffold26766_cov96-Isochrysis_galbana.AAC.1
MTSQTSPPARPFPRSPPPLPYFDSIGSRRSAVPFAVCRVRPRIARPPDLHRIHLAAYCLLPSVPSV